MNHHSSDAFCDSDLTHIWTGRRWSRRLQLGTYKDDTPSTTCGWRGKFRKKHLHSPQVLNVESFSNIQFIFSQSKIPNFTHCKPHCGADNWICRESLRHWCGAECKLLVIGLQIPLSSEKTLNWFKYLNSIVAWHQQPAELWQEFLYLVPY